MKVDRSILMRNDQNMGDIGDPDKLENSIEHLANVIDSNANTQDSISKDNTQNKTDISSLKSRATALETDNTSNKQRIGTNENRISSVQNQVNQLVVYGDSSAEAAQARVTATGKAFATLQERLNDGDTRLMDISVNVKQFNAKSNGVDDDTAAIQAAADYAFSLGENARLLIPRGKYKTTGTLMIKCELDATQATIEYYGNGTALKIGDDSAPNIVTPRKTFRLPRVINKNRGTNGWDGTSQGVLCINLNTCEVYVPFIQDFEKGLIVYGKSGGNAYTTYYLGALWENHKNLVLDTDETGYTNQNLFVNGRLQHSTTKGAVLDDPDACQIFMATPYGGGPNNNTFLNTSFEGENVAYYRVDMSGKYNQFINCRWEYVGNPPRVRYRATAQWNKIFGGYAVQSLIEVFDGTLGGGEINDNIGAFIRSENTSGQVIPHNTWTTITGWSTGAVRRASYDNSTGKWTPRPGRWLINATIMFTGNATGIRQLRIMCNNSAKDFCSIYPGTTNQVTLKASAVYQFNGKESFEIQTLQTSGADLALSTSGVFVKIEAEYLGR